MIHALKMIRESTKKSHVTKLEPWLKYLMETEHSEYNLRYVDDLGEVSHKSVLQYVTRTLEALNEEVDKIGKETYATKLVEETLIWSEVAKCGSKVRREKWIKRGYDLYIHNLASAEIYQESALHPNEIVYILIKTHGLIGQATKGELNLSKSYELTELVLQNKIGKTELKEVLVLLNKCIIKGVNSKLYEQVANEVNVAIDQVVRNEYPTYHFFDVDYIVQRFQKLFPAKPKEEFTKLRLFLKVEEIRQAMGHIFENFDLWYVDSALEQFSIEEILKIFLMTSQNIPEGKNHLNFSQIMNEMYYMYNGIKCKNLFRQRVMESYLDTIQISDILKGNFKISEHIKLDFTYTFHTVLVKFNLSIQARKLIEFCEVAYGTNEVYNQAVYMLYDLFGFRRDNFDRFYNEINYLNTMNSTVNQKAVILDYIVGNTVLYVGPGGGALMDLIASANKVKRVVGIDISENVVETLLKKKTKENRTWEIIKGDAFQLKSYFQKGEIDTIIFCSVIHELFSYIETEGKKFQYQTIELAMKSCFEVLPSGGRIIIRDGIMSETNQPRIIHFKEKADMRFLQKYCRDFQGREIKYECMDEKTVKMKENDAMEFLYTYTWGEESYPMEVQEQFGYYTPSGYLEMLQRIGNCRVIECKSYLQEGYEEHLLKKIEFYDENMHVTKLPNSTCLIVVEKR